MTQKSFTTLCAVTAAAVLLAAVAILSQPRFEASYQQGDSILPNLVQQAEHLKTVVIRQKGEIISLDREGGAWRARERHGFEADSEKVANLLIALARMTKLEGKTKDPARYARLEVEDPKDADAASRQVTLIDDAGKQLADVVLGKRQFNMGTQGNNTYVRLAGDPQVWLASGEVDDSATGVSSWLKKDVIDVASAQVARVTVTHPNGEKVVAKRQPVETPNMVIENLPKNTAAFEDGTADSYAKLLSALVLEDIVGVADKPFPRDQTHVAVIEGVTGWRVDMELAELDGAHWIKLKGTPPGMSKPGTDRVVDTGTDWTQTMNTLNARFADYAIAVPMYQVQPLKLRMTDLLTRKAEYQYTTPP